MCAHISAARLMIVSFLLCLAASSAHAQKEAKTEKPEPPNYSIAELRQIADLALVPPVINTAPLPRYDMSTQDYVMTLTTERTPKGRIWAAWIGGEDGPKAFLLAASSDDNGETWTKPRLVIDGHSPGLPIPRSVIIGNFWTDPLGRLWLFFDQSMSHFDGRAGLWATLCENPDAENPTWSPPKRIANGAMLNKPTMLSSGEWLLPAYLLQRDGYGPYKPRVFPELDPQRGVNVLASTDQGKTWEPRGIIKFPNPSWHEAMIVEKKNKQLWMMTRTSKGIMESFSDDKGRTWTEPAFTAANIQNTSARFFFRRLASGNLLLIKNGSDLHKADTKEDGGRRRKLSAWLSDDDGVTWKGGLLVEDRAEKRATYPDGFQAPDGTIFITYDYNRGPGQILMARFTEADILAGKLVSPQSKLKMPVTKPGKKVPKKKKPPAAKTKAATLP
ncbi:sialidase-1 [Ereboglobus sp. PH5-5]|uniref:sialidase family protein n=1 Tax=Ereboglobus sp. PH5-5 TaxID=2940529 RepID=UPI002406DDB5|nr:sialidase family protein [Ereboglobus sp. PH5-5]MDF9833970.1 sialidase-1 [Ereboglobus sp. PH5-5]